MIDTAHQREKRLASPGGWEKGLTLEDALRKAIREGTESEITPLLALIQDPQKKILYRAIWKEEREKKRRSSGISTSEGKKV